MWSQPTGTRGGVAQTQGQAVSNSVRIARRRSLCSVSIVGSRGTPHTEKVGSRRGKKNGHIHSLATGYSTGQLCELVDTGEKKLAQRVRERDCVVNEPMVDATNHTNNALPCRSVTDNREYL